MVKLLDEKIHLNNQHIEAVQDQQKLLHSTMSHICVQFQTVDTCLDDLVDKCCDQRNTIDTLTANLPFIVATQVHRGVNLSTSNEVLSAERHQYVHLSPK